MIIDIKDIILYEGTLEDLNEKSESLFRRKSEHAFMTRYYSFTNHPEESLRAELLKQGLVGMVEYKKIGGEGRIKLEGIPIIRDDLSEVYHILPAGWEDKLQ